MHGILQAARGRGRLSGVTLFRSGFTGPDLITFNSQQKKQHEFRLFHSRRRGPARGSCCSCPAARRGFGGGQDTRSRTPTGRSASDRTGGRETAQEGEEARIVCRPGLSPVERKARPASAGRPFSCSRNPGLTPQARDRPVGGLVRTGEPGPEFMAGSVSKKSTCRNPATIDDYLKK